MMVSRGSGRRGLLVAAVAGALLFGVTGCAEEGSERGVPKDYKVVAGTQLCGGSAVSADAARALKVITGSSRFEASAKEYTVAQAATNRVEEFPTPAVIQDICRVYTPIGTPEFQLRITWDLEDSAPTGASAPKFTALRMGERTVTAADMAYVFFECRSDRLFQSSEAAHIVVGVERGGMPTEPEGDVQELKDAYATVAHSFSLAMARELGCEKDGGLPERPVLDPA